MENCTTWLFGYLKNRVFATVAEVRKNAKAKGFTRKEIRKARESLGVKTHHPFQEDGPTENWFWYLPQSETA